MKDATKITKEAKSSLDIFEDVIIVASMGLLIALLGKRQLSALEKTVKDAAHALRDDLGRHAPPAESGKDAESDAAFHWSAMIEKLPQGMCDIGLTARQAQVAMGVIRQQTYQQIAEEMHVDERTVRYHARVAFDKVGCTKRTEFLAALMTRIQESG